MIWHVLAGEYPPDCGGVGDYSALVAQALAAAGDTVHVWTPARVAEGPSAVRLHPLPDRFAKGSRTLLSAAWEREPGIVLLQYVPNALGARGANVPFCRWLMKRARGGTEVRVVFHEPYFYFGWRRPWRNGLALAQRAMASLLLRAASHVYLSSERWIEYLRPYGPMRNCLVVPIPATVPDAAPGDVARFRHTFSDGGERTIGHFGTYGQDVANQLRPLVSRLAIAGSRSRLILIGDGGTRFLDDLKREGTGVTRCHATGRLSAREVAAAIAACDVVVQPYPDGVTTRRTSVMAALRNGAAVVTTDGFLTEPVWRRSGVALAPAGDPEALASKTLALLDDDAARTALAARGRRLYEEAFAIEHTIAGLRSSIPRPEPAHS